MTTKTPLIPRAPRALRIMCGSPQMRTVSSFGHAFRADQPALLTPCRLYVEAKRPMWWRFRVISPSVRDAGYLAAREFLAGLPFPQLVGGKYECR